AVVYDLTLASSPEDVPGRVARCLTCPMWFKLLTDPNGIPKAYPGEYGGDALAEEYLLGRAARAVFQEALANVESRGNGTRLRLLDIGAAQGALLEEAARLGFDAEGVDHCEDNVQRACAKGLKVKHLSVEDLDDESAFDVITMMDIIEHLPNPVDVLKRVARALKPGGELVVYTPNHRAAVVLLARGLHACGIRFPVREIFGRNHICFFDDQSLPRALTSTGFTLRALRQFPYDPSRPGQPISPVNLAAIALAERLGRPFGRVFRMLAYAKKR